MEPLKLLEEFVGAIGPPGEERQIREALSAKVSYLGLTPETDAKGNLLVKLGSSDKPKVVVTAHLDEIAMIVRRIESDGRLSVTSLGGLFPWKIGEGPVQILGDEIRLSGVLSFGSIHTLDAAASARRGVSEPISWEMGRVFTGITPEKLVEAGVRPGTRVVVHPQRRQLFGFGDFIASYFLDDRADLVAWLLALEMLKDSKLDVLFLASVGEEVGGEGASYALQTIRPDVCIALELGPFVNDAPVELSDLPTVWTTDSYAAMTSNDGKLISKIAESLEMKIQFQSLSRGGSDASCAASRGLCARPITLGIPMENTHGFEIIHKNSMNQLAILTSELLKILAKE